MTSSLLLLITSFMVFNWPKSFWITVLFLLPSQYIGHPLSPPWDLEELLASLCCVSVSFLHLLPIWTPSLTFIPKVILSFGPITYSYRWLPIFLWFFPSSAYLWPWLSWWACESFLLFSPFCQCPRGLCANLRNFTSLVRGDSPLLCYYCN